MIIIGVIFFVANKEAGQQGHSISVSGAGSAVISDETVGRKLPADCHRNFQSSSSCSSIHSRSPRDRPHYLPRRQRLETEVKYIFDSLSDACNEDSVAKLNGENSTPPSQTLKGNLRRNIDF